MCRGGLALSPQRYVGLSATRVGSSGVANPSHTGVNDRTTHWFRRAGRRPPTATLRARSTYGTALAAERRDAANGSTERSRRRSRSRGHEPRLGSQMHTRPAPRPQLCRDDCGARGMRNRSAGRQAIGLLCRSASDLRRGRAAPPRTALLRLPRERRRCRRGPRLLPRRNAEGPASISDRRGGGARNASEGTTPAHGLRGAAPPAMGSVRRRRAMSRALSPRTVCP